MSLTLVPPLKRNNSPAAQCLKPVQSLVAIAGLFEGLVSKWSDIKSDSVAKGNVIIGTLRRGSLDLSGLAAAPLRISDGEDKFAEFEICISAFDEEPSIKVLEVVDQPLTVSGNFSDCQPLAQTRKLMKGNAEYLQLVECAERVIALVCAVAARKLSPTVKYLASEPRITVVFPLYDVSSQVCRKIAEVAGASFEALKLNIGEGDKDLVRNVSISLRPPKLDALRRKRARGE